MKRGLRQCKTRVLKEDEAVSLECVFQAGKACCGIRVVNIADDIGDMNGFLNRAKRIRLPRKHVLVVRKTAVLFAFIDGAC